MKIIGVHYSYPKIISFQFILNSTYHNKIEMTIKNDIRSFQGARSLLTALLISMSPGESLLGNWPVWN